MCRGYGSRLTSRLLAEPMITRGDIAILPHESRTAVSPLLRIYKSYCDTALRTFAASAQKSLVHTSTRPEFHAEAEKWVNKAFGEQGALVSPVAATNGSVDVSNSSTATPPHGIVPSHSIVSSLGAAITSCLGFLHQLLMSKFDARPRSFVRMPASQDWNGVVLLSGGDRNAALAERVVANHEAFAQRHRYGYWWYRGSLVKQHGWLGYWHKIAMIRRAMVRFPDASAFAWLDDDIVLTNHASDMIAAALQLSNASVIVTRDPANWATLNTGVIIVRHDEGGASVMEEVWRRASLRRADGASLATDPQSRGVLHEQQALQEMLAESHWRALVTVLPQRSQADRAAEARHSSISQVNAAAKVVAATQPSFNLNTFLRWSHFDSERDQQMRFDADAFGSGWVRGDFAGHCSGLSSLRRALCVAVLLSSVIEPA